MELPAGSIVWASVPDPRGKNTKVRPLVVVASPEPDCFTAVAITTSVESFDDQCCVRLPWHRDGHPRTKLRSECIARCDWVVTLKVDKISRSGGMLPQHVLNAILSRLPMTT